MFDHRQHLYPRAALVVVLLGAATAAAPQSAGGPYEIRTHAIASGGPAAGGVFSVHGVAGQSSTGRAEGGTYSATVGVLRQREALPDGVFADGFEGG